MTEFFRANFFSYIFQKVTSKPIFGIVTFLTVYCAFAFF